MLIQNAKISYVCSILPSKKINNMDNPYFNEQTKSKIIRISDISERYILDRNKNESLLGLFKKSALYVMDELQWNKEDIDGIIVISQTHEYRFPATSILLQNELGLRHDCFAYDMIMGCSAYTYGLFSAMSHINKNYKKILLFCGDSINDFVYPKNKSVAFLFSDGASCTALEYEENNANHFYFYTDGSRGDAIIALDGGSKNPVKPSSFDEYLDDSKNLNNRTCMIMKGLDVFNFSAVDVSQHILNMLQIMRLTSEDIDLFFFHQANKIALNEIKRKLCIGGDKFLININKYGNASCASIPLLISEIQNIISKKALLVGFGVGLSICAVYIENLNCKTKLLFNS
ncbi:ketoacyl-ACP synthase III [Campylobacter volucris]|uniref:ketoacyl-ACP synthase III n=1 Tax=Campylobacter volucris TaxID=1031542 RepID=UPI00189EB115|nr:ketoacyl-ACP synthase III [Campylobacter volucris]MBF7049335.1 ketoacyl-ACP synthase III [Campylobacter volucris]MBF7060473.1 ketoacyl-ACP synthase III [Campylobacter volucris]